LLTWLIVGPIQTSRTSLINNQPNRQQQKKGQKTNNKHKNLYSNSPKK